MAPSSSFSALHQSAAPPHARLQPNKALKRAGDPLVPSGFWHTWQVSRAARGTGPRPLKAMMLYGFATVAVVPKFGVSEVVLDPFRLLGTLSSTEYGPDTWVKPGWLGDLRHEALVLSGRWSRTGDAWVFTPTAEDAEHLVGETREFQVLDGYWGERVWLTLDPSLSWRESIASDIPDHEHCRICWATISASENTHHYAADGLVICPKCYAAHIRNRSLDFTSLGGPAV